MKHLTTRLIYLALTGSIGASIWILHEVLYLSDPVTTYGHSIPDRPPLAAAAATAARSTPEAAYPRGDFCIAILTGFPEVDRAYYLRRILRSLAIQVALPSRRLDVNIYCQGPCSGTDLLRPYSDRAYNLNEISRVNVVPQSRRRRYASFLCKHGCAADHEIRNSVVLQRADGPVLAKNRWFFLSDNYRAMFDHVFHVRNKSYCAIFEDDLVLSADSLLYLDAGITLMDADRSVFMVSLNNDNSYPLYASDPTFFRRVSYFSGLGFLMSRDRYVGVLEPEWRPNRNWDTIVQRAVAKQNMVSIQPEVTRSAHIRSRDWPTSAPRDVFESQLLSDVISGEIDLSRLRNDSYNAYIADFIGAAICIEYLEDAMFYDVKEKLLYAECPDEAHLDTMLTERHLVGSGNGGPVRGSYLGTLFIRVRGVQVLIVCRTSPFYRRYRRQITDKKRRRHGNARARLRLAETLKTTPNVTRRHLGIVYALRRHYDVMLVPRNRSCAGMCADRFSRCDRVGLWLLNADCEVLLDSCPQCGKCHGQSGITPYVGYHPATDGHVVHLAFPHYLNCQLATEQMWRVCTCTKQS